jgi:hypothetical protein
MEKAQNVNIDDVSNAEAVLQRMIHERKTLENATATLATYKQVKLSLQSEQGKLNQVRDAVSEAEEVLKGVEGQVAVAKKKAEAEITQYVSGVREDAEKVVATMRKQVAEQQEELKLLQDDVVKLTQEHAALMRQYEQEMKVAVDELEAVKKEHAALVMSINNAAKQFAQ